MRVLEDADGDDRYEKSTLFADGLNFPTGLLTWKDGLFVTAAPDLLTGGGSSGSPKCVRIFRIGPGSVMNAMSRMSPPHPGHAKGNSSPTRAMSFAHAIREVSWEGGLSHESQRSPVVSPPAVCPPNACPPVAASRRLPTFAMARAVTAGLSL